MLDELEKGVRGLRVGFDRRFATEGIHPEQAAAIQAAVDALRRLGAQIVDVQMPDVDGVRNMWLILCAKEAVAAHAATFPSRKNEYGPYFREFLEMGAAVKPADYAKAVQYRKDLSTKYRAVLSTVDAFIYPAVIARAHPIIQGSPIRLDGGRQRRQGQIRKFVQAAPRSERVHVSSRSLRHTHDHASRWLLIRRAAAEHANRRTAAERTDVVPDRTCVRRSNRLVQEAPERLASAAED